MWALTSVNSANFTLIPNGYFQYRWRVYLFAQVDQST